MYDTQLHLDDWLSTHVSRLAPSTQRQYRELSADFATVAPTLDDFKSAKRFRRHFRAKASTPTNANRWKAVLSSFCSWLVEEELIDYNPVLGMKKFPENRRDRFMDERDLQDFAGGLKHYPGLPSVKACLRTLLSTGTRLNEAVGMEWDEIQFHADGSAEWKIPKERTKANRPLITWLSPRLALEIRSLSPDSDAYRYGHVFLNTECRKIRDDTVGQMMSRICERMGMRHFSPHDLRRTCITHLAKRGVGVDVRKAVANHAPTGVNDLVYNQYDYWPEKVEALTRWSQVLIETDILPDPITL